MFGGRYSSRQTILVAWFLSNEKIGNKADCQKARAAQKLQLQIMRNSLRCFQVNGMFGLSCQIIIRVPSERCDLKRHIPLPIAICSNPNVLPVGRNFSLACWLHFSGSRGYFHSAQICPAGERPQRSHQRWGCDRRLASVSGRRPELSPFQVLDAGTNFFSKVIHKLDIFRRHCAPTAK